MLEDAKLDMGLRIREARLRAGFASQDALARRLGIPRPSLTKIEGGTQGLSAETMAKLCPLLGVSADYLLFGNSRRLRLEKVAELAESFFGAVAQDAESDVLLERRAEMLVEAIEELRTAEGRSPNPAREETTGLEEDLRVRRAILEGEAEAELTQAYERRPAKTETPGRPAIGHGGEDGWMVGTDAESDGRRAE